MKAFKVQLFHVVRIEWLDSCAAFGWQNETVANSVKVTSIGIVVDCNDTDITITHSLMEGHKSWNCPLSIPWNAILSLVINPMEKIK